MRESPQPPRYLLLFCMTINFMVLVLVAVVVLLNYTSNRKGDSEKPLNDTPQVAEETTTVLSTQAPTFSINNGDIHPASSSG